MSTLRFVSARRMKVMLAVAVVLATLGSTLVLAVTAAPAPAAPAHNSAYDASSPASAVQAARTERFNRLQFHDAMRKLWEDHIIWTRLYIVSAAADLPDQDLVAARLLQNQVDIGNAIKPFYGTQAGDRLTALLNDHILIAVDIIAAAKAGDIAAFEEAKARWYANADQIATFLSRANPQNWPLAQMKASMRMHLDLTLQEASNRLQGNFAADIADYDAVHNHILGMADVLSNGIMKQFPGRFG